MKKFLAMIATVALCIACALGIAGCTNKADGKYAVYAPDGAPALSLAALAKNESDNFDVQFVKAETIKNYVTGTNPEADFAVLPVNAAVNFLRDGESYKMLGTVTHGNLYLMKKQGGEDISSAADLTKLVGKTVGIINLANVPGLTFKVILNDNNIAFNELKEGVDISSEAVNLRALSDASQAIPSNLTCDYFVVPEPAATTKQAVTNGKLSIAGSLQTLYGGENGYPQAVAVVKASVAESDKAAVDKFINSFNGNFLTAESTTASEIAEIIRTHYSSDTAPTFTAENLTPAVIANCGIRFVSAQVCKAEVIAFMEKFNAVSAPLSWGIPSDNFFYQN